MLQNEKVFHVNFQRYCNSKWIDLIFNPRSIRLNLKYSRKVKIFVLIGYVPLKKNLSPIYRESDSFFNWSIPDSCNKGTCTRICQVSVSLQGVNWDNRFFSYKIWFNQLTNTQGFARLVWWKGKCTPAKFLISVGCKHSHHSKLLCLRL